MAYDNDEVTNELTKNNVPTAVEEVKCFGGCSLVSSQLPLI